MKFFTPELYQRFNSPDDGVADHADQEWEQALQDYERHLQGLRDGWIASAAKTSEPSTSGRSVLPQQKLSRMAIRAGSAPTATTFRTASSMADAAIA